MKENSVAKIQLQTNGTFGQFCLFIQDSSDGGMALIHIPFSPGFIIACNFLPDTNVGCTSNHRFSL